MMPCNRADTRRGAAGSLGTVFTFFLGAGGLVVACRFSGLGPMLMVERPTSLSGLAWGSGAVAGLLEEFFVLFDVC